MLNLSQLVKIWILPLSVRVYGHAGIPPFACTPFFLFFLSVFLALSDKISCSGQKTGRARSASNYLAIYNTTLYYAMLHCTLYVAVVILNTKS